MQSSDEYKIKNPDTLNHAGMWFTISMKIIVYKVNVI